MNKTQVSGEDDKNNTAELSEAVMTARIEEFLNQC